MVVAGFMPAKTVLFDSKCKPVFDLGTGPYNIIKWNAQVSAETLFILRGSLVDSLLISECVCPTLLVGGPGKCFALQGLS